jgi:pentapeptide MXKDX repeat protein
MRRIILATALSLMCGSAFAQGSTGPSPQSDNMPKPGMANSGKNGGAMKSDTTTGSGMSKDGMAKDGMSGGMKKPAGGESKDGMGMNKGGAMSK